MEKVKEVSGANHKQPETFYDSLLNPYNCNKGEFVCLLCIRYNRKKSKIYHSLYHIRWHVGFHHRSNVSELEKKCFLDKLKKWELHQ